MKQTKKNNFKKTFFSCLDSKGKPAKKQQNACFVFIFLSNLSKNKRSPTLALFFNKQAEMRKFFFVFFFICQKTKLPTDKLFFFVNKTFCKIRNRNQAKKKLNWSFCFFVHSFRLLPLGQTKKNALLLLFLNNKSEQNTLVVFEVGKAFLNLHCCSF